MKPHTITVSAENMAALDRVAAECGITSERGPAAGQPSGRALVRAIAEGRVTCRPTGKRKLKAKNVQVDLPPKKGGDSTSDVIAG